VDALTGLACLLVGIALPLAALFLLVRRGMRQLAVAEAYGDVSRRLGLPVDTRGLSLQGYLGQRRIWVGSVMVGHGPDRRQLTWGVVDLERPLALGLLIRRRGLSERIFRRARSPEVALPDEELERNLEVHGDDPRAVRELLRPEVLVALDALVSRWRDVVVTDQSVRVHLPAPLARTDELQELVDGLTRLADALYEARRHGAPAPALADLVDGYEALASELGLQLVPCFPGLEGSFEGHEVTITPARAQRGYGAEVRLAFAEHRPTGLLVERQTAPDGYWSVGQDIQVADEAFDKRFVVKGYDPQAITELLSDEARAALLSLSERGEVTVDDVHLRVQGLPLASESLREVVQLAAKVAHALQW
jgi:hypothetical protein